MNIVLNVCIVLIAVMGIIGCATETFDIEADPFNGEVPPEFVDQSALQSYASEHHGVVNIHRHGPGFDILMTLNAGDSDMIFSMDLPEDGETFMPEVKRIARVKALHEEGTVSTSAGSAENEKSFFNDQTVTLFSEATKHMLSAQALFYRKSYWKALEETNKAVSLVPQSAQAYALKGSIYFKMGRKKEAKSAWQEALKLDPSLVDVEQSLKRIR